MDSLVRIVASLEVQSMGFALVGPAILESIKVKLLFEVMALILKELGWVS